MSPGFEDLIRVTLTDHVPEAIYSVEWRGVRARAARRTLAVRIATVGGAAAVTGTLALTTPWAQGPTASVSIVTPNASVSAIDYPLINSTLVPGEPPDWAISAAAARAVAEKGASFPIPDVEPLLTYGIFTDHNEEVFVAEGGKPYGLVNREVWVIAFNNVPPNEIPPKSGPANPRESPPTATDLPNVPYQVLYIVDARDGTLLVEDIMPQDPSVMMGTGDSPKPSQ